MEGAIRAVQQDGMTVSAAAKQYIVPRKTLGDWRKSHVEHGTNPGLSSLLRKRMRWLPICFTWQNTAFHSLQTWLEASRGQFLYVLVQVDGSTRKRGQGSHWWRNYHSLHPELTLRIADNLERA
jgi:hypothetical protein